MQGAVGSFPKGGEKMTKYKRFRIALFLGFVLALMIILSDKVS